jgi:AraC-like DNA-binding protein
MAPWLNQTVDLFRAEHLRRSVGHSAVLSHLTQIICIQALRVWIDGMPPDSKGWLRGLTDPHVALALQAIHRDPGHHWTVGSLARQAGMSRTMFALRFKAAVGHPPMEYVARWRMHQALNLMEHGGEKVKSVVAACGYKSATAFRIHFERHVGMRPSDYRRD